MKMTRQRIAVSKLIVAPPARIYSIIADYEHGHQRILPRPPFVSMTVTRGGFGAGTEFDLVMRVLGRLQSYRGVVAEPEPGRTIVERYVGTSMVTSFTIEPREQGRSSEVTIATESDGRDGLLGVVGRWLAARVLSPVYGRELERLAAVATRPPVDERPEDTSHGSTSGHAS
jgi:hypothetical protein